LFQPHLELFVALFFIQGARGKLSGAVLSMAFDSSGKILWAGDENVSVQPACACRCASCRKW